MKNNFILFIIDWFNYYNLQSSKKNKYNNLMNNLEDILNNYDILTKFHEVGMFSRKISIKFKSRII